MILIYYLIYKISVSKPLKLLPLLPWSGYEHWFSSLGEDTLTTELPSS